MHLITRQTCRICGSRGLREVINLGEQQLQGSFVKEGVTAPPQRKIPCVLVRCDTAADEKACGLLQMKHSVPGEILYSDYWYRSGTNETMRRHLAGVAQEAVRMVAVANDECRMTNDEEMRVLDIGCNDGTLLNYFAAGAWQRTGVDPSDIARKSASESDSTYKLVSDVFPSPALNDQEFDVITSIAMFYDLEEPVRFVNAIADCLAVGGVWIVEMSYMPRMLASNSYDTICHEHLEYYSLAVIENLLQRADLKVFRAEANSINGGSIRCYVTHKESRKWEVESRKAGWEEELKRLRRAEFDLELDTDKPYLDFQARVQIEAEKLHDLLEKIARDGKRVHIYGASTKGNTILQWSKITKRLIDYAADRNPEKWGATTLGTEIPIISEEDSRALKPDYYLVLPWHFREEFMERERAALEAGVGFIFPLPKITVVTSCGEG